jgi:hypothetical protein
VDFGQPFVGRFVGGPFFPVPSFDTASLRGLIFSKNRPGKSAGKLPGFRRMSDLL